MGVFGENEGGFVMFPQFPGGKSKFFTLFPPPPGEKSGFFAMLPQFPGEKSKFFGWKRRCSDKSAVAPDGKRRGGKLGWSNEWTTDASGSIKQWEGAWHGRVWDALHPL